LRCRGIGGRALQHTQLVVDREDRFDGTLDICQRAASRREEHRFSEGGDTALQGRVAEVAGRELERRYAELREQVRALEVERGRKERDAGFTCVTQQFTIVVRIELERLAVLTVRGAETELVLVRLVKELARVERAVRALLQLDRIHAALLRRVDQPLRLLEV